MKPSVFSPVDAAPVGGAKLTIAPHRLAISALLIGIPPLAESPSRRAAEPTSEHPS